MLHVVFWLAVACGCLSASTGNRTAWALLASVGLCLAFDHFGVPFHFILWLLIDLAVILAIIRPAMTTADVVIVALFIPAWVAYLLPEGPRFELGFLVVVAQLLLTFPAVTVHRAIQSFWKAPSDDGFDKRMVHA